MIISREKYRRIEIILIEAISRPGKRKRTSRPTKSEQSARGRSVRREYMRMAERNGQHSERARHDLSTKRYFRMNRSLPINLNVCIYIRGRMCREKSHVFRSVRNISKKLERASIYGKFFSVR